MSDVPLPEPVAFRTRYRSEPGMLGHYPWTYSDKQRKWTIREAIEHEQILKLKAIGMDRLRAWINKSKVK